MLVAKLQSLTSAAPGTADEKSTAVLARADEVIE